MSMSEVASGIRSDLAVCTKPRQPQFFFHVPKTGGSTIKSYLGRGYGQENVIYPEKNKVFLVDVFFGRKYKALPEVQHADAPLLNIAGHFASLSIIMGRESKYQKVCFWRHPADWSLSCYNWRYRREKRRERKPLKRPYSFSDFVKSLPHNPMSQDFLLYCGDLPGWRYFFMSDRQKFRKAIALAERFDIFADISRVDEYLDSAKLAENRSIERHNTVSERERALQNLDPTTRRRLEALSPVDYYIHRFAVCQDKAKVLAEADAALSNNFPFRDALRLFVRVYYRFKVNFIPFI